MSEEKTTKKRKRSPRAKKEEWKTPEDIQRSPIMQQARVSERGLAKFQKRILLTYTPAMMRAFFSSLLRLVEEGNMQAMQLYAEMAHMIDRKGSFSIITQILNPAAQNVSMGRDAFLRQLAERRKELPAGDVIDVQEIVRKEVIQ